MVAINIKSIVFWAIFVVFLLLAWYQYDSTTYMRSLGCDKLIIRASNNGSISNLCDSDVLKGYQATIDTCSALNLTVVR